MVELAVIAGGRPVIVDSPRHFQEVDFPDLVEADPDQVVILPCGFDVPRTLRELDDVETRAGLGRIRAVREGRCTVVDGNALFNRPGPRLAESAEVLAAILHPDLFPDFRERYGHWITPWSATPPAS